MPSTRPAPLAQRGATLVEITIRDIGKPTMRSEALVGRSMAELNKLRAERALRGPSDWKASFDLTVPAQSGGELGDATIQLAPLSTGAFTVSGQRYFNATFRVRNAQKTDEAPFDTPRRNLTFVPVSTTAPATLLDSPVLTWLKPDGSQANQELVRELKPTGLAATDGAGHIIGISPDVLQALTEPEVAAIDRPDGVTNVFPYGFMTKLASNPASPRVLPPSPDETDFAGVMTVAFRLSVQGTAEDPTTISLMLLALDDSETRMTQSLEEQDPAAQARVQPRATAIGATLVRVLGSHPAFFLPRTQRICSLRTTGLAGAPTATLVNLTAFESLNPSPYSALGSRIATNTSLSATFTAPVTGANSSTFVVRGLISGQQFRSTPYPGTSGTTVSTPAGSFQPSEEVEVTLTQTLVECFPWVGRLRVGTPTPSNGVIAAATQTAVTATVNAIGDFDGNGTLDIASADSASSTVTIWHQDNTGVFTPGPPLPTTGTGPASIVTGDFNNDGFLDLVTGNSTNASLFLGHGDGTFAAATSIAVGGTNSRISVGDLNGDGRLDIVSANVGSGSVSILLGSGTGTFQSAGTITINVLTEVAIGDVNEDGTLDLIVAFPPAASTVYLGHGDGAFTPIGRTFNTFSDARQLALGDVNGDGHLDLAVAENSAGTPIAVSLGNGDGTFQPTPTTYPAGGGFGKAIALADMNGDGHLDLVVGTAGNQPAQGFITVRINNQSGAFPTEIDTPTNLQVFRLKVADINRDGIIDVVLGNRPFPIFFGQAPP